MKMAGSIVIGFITGIFIPIYNGKEFNIKNLLALIVFLILWFIIYSLFEKTIRNKNND